jgi:hypothetical protein
LVHANSDDLSFSCVFKDTPNDIVCRYKDDHSPSCENCVRGFSVISKLQVIIEKKLRELQLSFAICQPCSFSDEPSSPQSSTDCDDESTTTTRILEATISKSPANVEQQVDNEETTADWSKANPGELKAECVRRKIQMGNEKQQTKGKLRKLISEDIERKSGKPGAEFVGMGVNDLKEVLKKNGLKTTGVKQELLARLVQFRERQAAVARDAITMRNLSEQELLALQQLEELRHDIDCRKADLIEYRSHMARHLSEDIWAAEQLENLKDDEAIVTSDFKMKILSCFFRENQKKWFGKRGTTLLGFMITTNATDEESKAKGLKEVTFVMMVTDDCLQDDWEVACAKSIVYKEYLPERTKKVQFVSDGAGCFKSQLQRALQPFWKIWTGVDEIVYRLTPAGDGKSALDGMFGRLNTVLSSAVNMGTSYWNSQTIADAMAESNGLASTQFARFEPDRSRQIEGTVNDINLESILLTALDPSRENTDQSTLAFKHSGYGKGQCIDPSKQVGFQRRRMTGGKKKKEDFTPIEGVYNIDVSCSCLIRNCFAIPDHCFLLFQGTINREKAMQMEPMCSLFQRTENLKSFMTTKLAKAGEGMGLSKVRQGKKRKRLENRAHQKQSQLESERDDMRSSGLYICNSCCPTTQRYCRQVYLEERGLEKHSARGKHDFPIGVNARDFVLHEASKPGGLVELGSRPDRQKKDGLFENIVASEDGARGEEDAWCFGQFNRKENVQPYYKPPRLLEVLEELYTIEPKLRACEMRDRMKTMKDTDAGGLLFCFSKRYTTGMLLADDQIQSWINSRTQKKKNASKGSRTEKEKEEDSMIQQREIA